MGAWADGIVLWGACVGAWAGGMACMGARAWCVWVGSVRAWASCVGVCVEPCARLVEESPPVKKRGPGVVEEKRRHVNTFKTF